MLARLSKESMSSKVLTFIVVVAGMLLLSADAYAQRKDKLKYDADLLVGGRINGRAYRKLKNNVVLTQKNTIIYCDSAFLYDKENLLEAFGNVRIVDNDTITITGRKLIYDGNGRKAQMRDNVVYTSGENQLFTDFLDYEMDTRVAYYFNNGRLVDANNTLSSRRGYFYSYEDKANFFGKVELLSPEYTLLADTLRYNTITKIAVTEGRTEIITSDSTFLHSNGGEFKTIPEQSSFVRGQIDTRDYILEGDELFFDDQNKFYTATGNVKMTAKNNDVIITGEKGIYWRNKGLSKVFGNPVMKKVMQADTFYLAADTLVSIEDKTDSLKRILAYNRVRMYRSNLQGKADSLAYFIADSSITFYFDPVLWNLKNQINSDTIHLYLKNNVIDEMAMRRNAFIASEDTLRQYNQVKGRTMRAYFADSRIRKVNVEGNGESIYYVLSDGDSLLMGMNRLLCSNMTMRFNTNELENISFYVSPEATFYPPHEITDNLTRLDGFAWRVEERPSLPDVLNPPKEIPLDSLSTDSLEKARPALGRPTTPRETVGSGTRRSPTGTGGPINALPTGTSANPASAPVRKGDLPRKKAIKKKENG